MTCKRSVKWGLGAVLATLSALSGALAAPTLNGAGATFPYPLYSKWFDVYAQKTGVRINYQSIGSGGGIKAVQAHTVDFGASDAPLSDEEIKQMPAPVVHIPTVAGAVAVVYNLPGVGTGLKLDGATLANIYLGKIKNWNDARIVALNRGLRLPSRAIAVAHRSDGSGTSYIYTNYLAAVSPEWKTKVGAGKSVNWPAGVGGKGNEGVAGLVRQLPGGIGYVELAYALQNHLTYAAMRNASGRFTAPNLQTTAAAAAGAVPAMKRDIRVSIVNAKGPNVYPIAGFTYLLAYRQLGDAERGKALIGFLNWALRDGQKLAPALMYVPLPAGVVALNQRTVKTLRAG
jgi:phosphate transport system substrate-binding protein